MNQMLDLNVEFLVGDCLSDMQTEPLPPYSEEVVGFLNVLSKKLLKNNAARNYPDVVTFAYWCRKANLMKLANARDKKNIRIGRGLAFHIAPANVPVNFAFSFAFGMLAGNSNVVRVSEVLHEQTKLICETINSVFKHSEHARVAAMNRVIYYPRDDDTTSILSQYAQARILWGGDETIAHIRSMPSPPRCVDICFSNRYSICIMSGSAILRASQEGLFRLVTGFYNDVFTLDQNACSSPHLVLWQGTDTEVKNAKALFWAAVESLLLNKQALPYIQVIDKQVHLCRTAITLEVSHSIENSPSTNVNRVNLASMPEGIEKFRGAYGFFFEYTDNDLVAFDEIVNERFQTVTYFGVDPNTIINRVVKSGLLGVDRVVPVGKALDIGVIWDGYDIISTLSRVIVTV